jgi:hypothetical protein
VPENDTLSRVFIELAGADLPVPSAERVRARGRQRRQRSRIVVSAAAALMIVAVSAAVYSQRLASQQAARPLAGRLHPARGTAPSAGSGRLLLGLRAGRGGFEMSRAGGTGAVPVEGLRAVVANQSLIATSPAGGWVVTEGIGPPDQLNSQAERLAAVSVTGAVRPFGPVFTRRQNITSIAVRPDGTAVAVAVLRVTPAGCLCSAAQIKLVPMPGQRAVIRTWTLATATSTIVQDLSWATGGTELTYLPGGDQTGGGFSTRGPVTFSTAQRGSTAPDVSDWPGYSKAPGTCNVNGGTWAGRRYLALEGCTGGQEILLPVNPRTGARAGRPVQVSGWACPAPQFSAAAGGGPLVISFCGPQLESRGRFRLLPGSLVLAAYAGGR